MRDIIRRCRFSPYRKGMGPTFGLAIWDTGRYDSRGQTVLGYRLSMSGKTCFEGEDFSGSPLHADDSDATVRALMSFLTDESIIAEQCQCEDYAQNAEALAMCVYDRFGEG